MYLTVIIIPIKLIPIDNLSEKPIIRNDLNNLSSNKLSSPYSIKSPINSLEPSNNDFFKTWNYFIHNYLLHYCLKKRQYKKLSN